MNLMMRYCKKELKHKKIDNKREYFINEELGQLVGEQEWMSTFKIWVKLFELKQYSLVQ